MSDPVVLLSTGDVVGPAGGVTDNSMVLFSGTSGKLIKGNNAVVTAAGLALLDDVNAAAQRTTLGLGTAATATLTTSATDTTAGRVLKVGDFGLGTTAVHYGGDLNLLGNVTGFYRTVSGATNFPNGCLDSCFVHIGSGDTYSQTFVGYGSSRMFTRGGVGVVPNINWQPWREVALTDSPAFIGTPTAPTAGAGTNNTQLANTAFVKAAVDAAPMLGVGQTWQNVTASRNLGVTYTNTTGKAITVIEVSEYFNNADPLSVYVNGLSILAVDQGVGQGWDGPVTFIVPSGATYSIAKPVYPNIKSWLELRS